jgi:hypothetical protein
MIIRTLSCDGVSSASASERATTPTNALEATNMASTAALAGIPGVSTFAMGVISQITMHERNHCDHAVNESAKGQTMRRIVTEAPFNVALCDDYIQAAATSCGELSEWAAPSRPPPPADLWALRTAAVRGRRDTQPAAPEWFNDHVRIETRLFDRAVQPGIRALAPQLPARQVSS